MKFDSAILNAFAGVSDYPTKSWATQDSSGSQNNTVSALNATNSQLEPGSLEKTIVYGNPEFKDQVSPVIFRSQDHLLGLRKLTVRNDRTINIRACKDSTSRSVT